MIPPIPLILAGIILIMFVLMLRDEYLHEGERVKRDEERRKELMDSLRRDIEDDNNKKQS